MLDEGQVAAAARHHARQPAAHRLDQGLGVPLGEGRQYESIDGSVLGGEVALIDHAAEDHVGFARLLSEGLLERALPDHHQGHGRGSSAAPSQARRRLHRSGDVLLPGKAAHVEHAEGAAGDARAPSRHEARGVHAVGNQLDASSRRDLQCARLQLRGGGNHRRRVAQCPLLDLLLQDLLDHRVGQRRVRESVRGDKGNLQLSSPARRPVERGDSRDLEDPEHMAAAQLLALLVHHSARPLAAGQGSGRREDPGPAPDGGLRGVFLE